MVRQIERFGPELNRVAFSNTELSRQPHIDLDASWTPNTICSVPPLAVCRARESRRVKPLVDTSVGSVGIGEHLMGAVAPC